MVFTRDELLATAELSPQAAGAHDRQAWVGLFAAGGQVEDPVGSRPHRGTAEIERFYDTFIGPRDITFHRDVDIVAGSTVVRDLELEVEMSRSVTMRIPAYLRYAVVADPAGPRIAELQAYWELPTMIGQFAGAGVGAVPVGLRLAGALLRNQGPSGALGFAKGMSGAGREGRRLVTGLLDDLCAGDEVAVQRRLGGAVVRSGDDAPLTTSGLLERTSGASWRKLIVSGSSVVAGLDRDGRRAVLIADLSTGPRAVTRLRHFTDAT
ncbi:nuclear transport factor 2 family protein [Mycolicibacterium neworleansense]|uniref:Steroid delta-isomerase n=1 Tax=Mycolicibacterium neworleansense TaxID=146018 RepID=A0A0H5RJY4_9MYCO|nr:ketosteroid isomerase family protein [Mycolicibacterium neworleansense]MCV7361777.1 nuclear transport factor 2 family protein [Mycolicibacterium neworleansense]CRZ14081.1 steroid delta-isomerase [Mycolicibacterium neworleansense]